MFCLYSGDIDLSDWQLNLITVRPRDLCSFWFSQGTFNASDIKD